MLQLNHVDVCYGSFKALTDISMTVDAGELVVLLGANGAGKSSLFNAISGLVKPTAGEIQFEDKQLNGMKASAVVASGVVQCAEGRKLFPQMSVMQNLMMGAYVHRRDRQGNRKRLNEVLELFPILADKADKPAGSLSGGQQQMVAIGRAMMGQPRLLLLDEPFIGVAPIVVTTVLDVLRRIAGNGVTVLLVEQNVHRALEFVDRAYVIDNGRTVHEGQSKALLNDGAFAEKFLGLE